MEVIAPRGGQHQGLVHGRKRPHAGRLRISKAALTWQTPSLHNAKDSNSVGAAMTIKSEIPNHARVVPVGSSNPSGGCSVRTVMKFQRSLSVPNLFPSKLLRGSSNALTSAKINIARTRAPRKPESPDWERYSETERRPGSDPRAWQACHPRYRNQLAGSARARQNQQLGLSKH
jgi:hypothetical protein